MYSCLLRLWGLVSSSSLWPATPSFSSWLPCATNNQRRTQGTPSRTRRGVGGRSAPQRGVAAEHAKSSTFDFWDVGGVDWLASFRSSANEMKNILKLNKLLSIFTFPRFLSCPLLPPGPLPNYWRFAPASWRFAPSAFGALIFRGQPQ